IGVEFGRVNSSAVVYDLVKLGDGSPAQDSPEEVPHHLTLDRCYIHGDDGGELKRGVSLQSAHTEILNSHVSGFKVRGQDAQAVAGWNGPGPYRIVNNYLEGAGENLIFGGARSSVPGQTPSDILISRNHISKPASWRGRWTVKNLLELKHARRVRIEGNLLEHCWLDAQQGYAVLFTPRPSDSGDWAVVEDVEFVNNVVRRVAAGVHVSGQDDLFSPAPKSRRLRRVRVANNLFEGIDHREWGGDGSFLKVVSGAEQLTVEHNTVLHTGWALVKAGGEPTTGFVFRHNIARHNEYGVHGDSVGYGNPALAAFFPGGTFAGNVIAKEVGAPWNTDIVYPQGNWYPDTLGDVRFENLQAGDYRLSSASPYKGAAADGGDIGCDLGAINAALSGGSAPSATPTPTPTATPSPTPSATPTPTPAPSLTTTTLVGAAYALAFSLAAEADADPARIASLVTDVERAHAVFVSESGKIAAASQVDTSLRAALYFARAAAALATTETSSTGVQSRLQITALHLSAARDLLPGGAGSALALPPPASSPVARAAVIGSASTLSAAGGVLAVAAGGAGSITGDPAQSPLATVTRTASPDSAGRFPYELEGVSVTIAGTAAQLLSVSPSRVAFVAPEGLAEGDAEVIVTLQEGYVSRGVATVSAVAPGLFTADGTPTGEALVMNAADYTRGIFKVYTPANLSGTDRRTRLMIFATGLRGAANADAANDVRAPARANVAESVAVEARLQNGLVYWLPVEYAGAAAARQSGVDQVNALLPNQLSESGVVELTIVVGGKRSNTARIVVN
ncbi:MAG TPA: hypothetical protein VD968_11820, partial [Pyrinomonadaceae bacterium]|nr:hypothetical protein [Pyrinomonadaceae bacterium]